jgi:hypothetical protein
MNRQMFKKGGAAGFPDLSGDGKITRKDVLMGRGVEFKQDGGPAGRVPNDVQAIFNGLVKAMRGSEDDVARYVAQNQQDLMDIAKMFPNTAPYIDAGFGVLSKKAGLMQGPRMPAAEIERLREMERLMQGPRMPAAEMERLREMSPSMGPAEMERLMGDFDDFSTPDFQGPSMGPAEMERLREIERLRERERLMQGPRMPAAEMERLREMLPSIGPGESVTESPLTTEENGRFNVYPPTQMQMGGEPMAAAMEQGNMAPAPMPANLGPAEMDGIASQVNPEVLAMLQGAARSFGDPEQAERGAPPRACRSGWPERRAADARLGACSFAAHDVVDGLAGDRSGHWRYWPHGTNCHGRASARGYGRGDHVDGRPRVGRSVAPRKF